jgi:adenylyl cyclase-associated protein
MDDHLKRLEAVTTRLESLVGQLPYNGATGPSTVNDESANQVDSLPILRDYDSLINESVKPFLAVSQKIGGDLITMSDHVARLFNAQQQFLRQAVQSKKPGDQQLIEAIKPQSSEIEAITGMNQGKKMIVYYFFIGFTAKNRKSPLFNHLSAVSEGIPALGWILVAPTPGPHIKDMTDAAQFYSNRVLKDFKEKEATHAEWVKLWVKVLNDLYTYVKQHHTTGLAWSSQGKRDFGSVSAATPKPVVAAGSGPLPPPPPPPPPPPMMFDTSLDASADNSRNELMDSINALGHGVTSRLKKVPDELKTHKNPQLRENAGINKSQSF